MKSASRGTWVTVSVPDADHVRFRAVRVRVLAGPSRGVQGEFTSGLIRIGARPENDIVLADPRVSGLHCEIRVDRHGVRLRDPGSTNGTWIGTLRIHDATVLPGVEITVGDHRLRIEEADAMAELALPHGPTFGPLVGRSQIMRELFARLARIAAADVPVLITGETGSGKELVARAIHEASARAVHPLVVVDCASLPANLIESELFGYEKGAFTGADRSFPGAFERAGAGTVFLDEFGELPIALQPKLLRVLDSRQVRRLGSATTLPVRANVLAATNRDLGAMVAQGTFRSDLYYRQAVTEVRIPPLRERPEDIALLAEHFTSLLGRTASLDPNMLRQLEVHSWPGNVRELRNAIQRIVLLDEPPMMQPSAPTAPAGGIAAEMRFDMPYKEARDHLLADFRRRYAQAVLERAGGSVSGASRLAGVDRMTLYRMLRDEGDVS